MSRKSFAVSSPPEFLGFAGLSPQTLRVLIVKAYSECDLKDEEQLVFGFRHHLLEGDFEEEFPAAVASPEMEPEMIAEKVALYGEQDSRRVP